MMTRNFILKWLNILHFQVRNEDSTIGETILNDLIITAKENENTFCSSENIKL